MPNLNSLALMSKLNPNRKNAELMPELNLKHIEIWHLRNMDERLILTWDCES